MYCNLMVQSCSVCLYLHFFFNPLEDTQRDPLYHYWIKILLKYLYILWLLWLIGKFLAPLGAVGHKHTHTWSEKNATWFLFIAKIVLFGLACIEETLEQNSYIYSISFQNMEYWDLTLSILPQSEGYISLYAP